jgi:hypothetical protein
MTGNNPQVATLTMDSAKNLVKGHQEDESYQTILETNKALGIDNSAYEHRIVEIPIMKFNQGVDPDEWFDLDKHTELGYDDLPFGGLIHGLEQE